MAEIIEVRNDEDVKQLADLASCIWHEYFPPIIGMEQVDYMVEKFQSYDAIKRQIADEGYSYFFVMADGEYIGYIGATVKGDRLFLSKLYLKKECRGRGYASQMLAFVEGMAVGSGCRAVYLTVNRHNSDTIAIYKKKGFVTIDEQAANIGGGYVMDDYIMERPL